MATHHNHHHDGRVEHAHHHVHEHHHVVHEEAASMPRMGDAARGNRSPAGLRQAARAFHTTEGGGATPRD